jgi:hypothetical protein
MSRAPRILPRAGVAAIRAAVRATFGRSPRIGRRLPLYTLGESRQLSERSLQAARFIGWIVGLRILGIGPGAAQIYRVRRGYAVASLSVGPHASVLVKVVTGQPRRVGIRAARLLMAPSLDLIALWQPKRGRDVVMPLRPLSHQPTVTPQPWADLVPGLQHVRELRESQDDRPRRFRNPPAP